MITRVKIPSLVIPNGQAVSNILKAKEIYDDADTIMLHGPAALDAFTFTLEVTGDENATPGSNWRTLQIGDPYADATPPPATKSRTYYELSTAAAFRIKSSSNVIADRTWDGEKSTSI